MAGNPDRGWNSLIKSVPVDLINAFHPVSASPNEAT